MSILAERTNEPTAPRWASIDWRTVETTVRRLQERIYRATERGERRKARSLQQLLVRAMIHVVLRKGSSDARTFLTARKIACLAALCCTPSVRPISSMLRPS